MSKKNKVLSYDMNNKSNGNIEEIKLPTEPFIPDLMNQLLKENDYINAYDYYTSYFIKTDTQNKILYYYNFADNSDIAYFDARPLDSPCLFNDLKIMTIKSKKEVKNKDNEKEIKVEYNNAQRATTYFHNNWPTFKVVERLDLDCFLFKKVYSKTFKPKNGEPKTYTITEYFFNQRPRIDQHREKSFEDFDDEAKNGVEMFWFIIQYIWASNNTEYYYYLRNWFIDVINLKRTGTCIYNKAQQGSGKSTINEFLIKVIGPRYAIEDGIRIFSRFNINLKDKIFVSCEELHHVSQSQWQEINGQLKQMITNNFYSVEGKYVNSEMIRMYANFIINTNDKFLKVEDDDRRFFMSEIRELDKNLIFKFGEKFDIEELKGPEINKKFKNFTELKEAFWTIIHKYLGVKGEDTELRQNVRKCFYSYCRDTYDSFVENKNNERYKDVVDTYFKYPSSRAPKTDYYKQSLKRSIIRDYIIENYLKKGIGFSQSYENGTFTNVILTNIFNKFRKLDAQRKYIQKTFKEAIFTEFKIKDDEKEKYIIKKANKAQYFDINFQFMLDFYLERKILTNKEIRKIKKQRFIVMKEVKEKLENETKFKEIFPSDYDNYEEYAKLFEKETNKSEITATNNNEIISNPLSFFTNTNEQPIKKEEDKVIKKEKEEKIIKKEVNETENDIKEEETNKKKIINFKYDVAFLFDNSYEKYKKPYSIKEKTKEEYDKCKNDDNTVKKKEKENVSVLIEGKKYKVNISYNEELNTWNYINPNTKKRIRLLPKETITFEDENENIIIFYDKYNNYFKEENNSIMRIPNVHNEDDYSKWYKDNFEEDSEDEIEEDEDEDNDEDEDENNDEEEENNEEKSSDDDVESD